MTWIRFIFYKKSGNIFSSKNIFHKFVWVINSALLIEIFQFFVCFTIKIFVKTRDFGDMRIINCKHFTLNNNNCYGLVPNECFVFKSWELLFLPRNEIIKMSSDRPWHDSQSLQRFPSTCRRCYNALYDPMGCQHIVKN